MIPTENVRDFKLKINYVRINKFTSNLGPVHADPDKFENASFFLRFGQSFTLKRRFRSPKTKLLENGLQNVKS